MKNLPFHNFDNLDWAKIVTMKNGRKAVQGFAAEDPTSKVFRILGDKEVAEVEKQIG